MSELNKIKLASTFSAVATVAAPLAIIAGFVGGVLGDGAPGGGPAAFSGGVLGAAVLYIAADYSETDYKASLAAAVISLTLSGGGVGLLYQSQQQQGIFAIEQTSENVLTLETTAPRYDLG